ncbi:MAG: ABC transporter ATP-binding protein [Desulfobacteraceae bacterium]|nr:ABC transporter ATP-binding protein [Desulfobacteraceae bacterium]
MEKDIILNVKDMSVAFDTEAGMIHAVDQLSFDLAKGIALGVVGESGCGKSVTALSIMRLLPKPVGQIINGSIIYNDHDILKFSSEEMAQIRGKKIAMIFQEPMTALNPVHSIGKQIKEVYTLHFPDMTKEEIKHSSIEMLAKVEIADPEKVLKLYPHQLSGGMRQRVMIAMALASKPDILIADEPTTALDVTVQAQILDLIKELQNSFSMSVILITHDLGVIAENCDEAIVMYAGRVAEKAKVTELFNNPQHPYTKGLLNSIPALSHKTCNKKKAQLPTIKGQVPSLMNMPKGCRFSPRCPDKQEICANHTPGKTDFSPDHSIFCHLFDIGNGENQNAGS